MPVIECDHLTHYYGDKPALLDVSWTLQPGRICGLLGRNGAGKTTTINILNSFLTPRSGRCLLLGEDSRRLTPAVKSRIGYLIEGHIQYGFFNIHQIEKFYSRFYPHWNPAIYYHLMSKLDITPRQRIATMSCGQRSQVALGLILAQNPDLIIFDDYSMGLDPGYRRLFIEVIRDYAADGKRSILLTSHIIQDLENLIDDCIIYQNGRVLIDTETARLRADFRKYTFATTPAVTGFPAIADIHDEPAGIHLERGEKQSALYGFLEEHTARAWLAAKNIPAETLRPAPLTLEDTFIALTGKY
ncbi:MAG: ABC transporter ATP-binding protein [Opitutaceae bacterium]|jgi:ABC-2 type transport system ATP-binding protein|nr:ABC transporter ATP-binding protein [Opitutaceae bacterium]